MSYYDEKQFIAAVDKNDMVIDRVEKWEAHKKGILHRGFTVALMYQDAWVIQCRKHPVFDSVLDISCSSHPIFTSDGDSKTEDLPEAVIKTIHREWDLGDEVVTPALVHHRGSTHYKALDPLSEFVEHEICHFLTVKLHSKPKPRDEFAYGMLMVPRAILVNKKNMIRSACAPWLTSLLPYFNE